MHLPDDYDADKKYTLAQGKELGYSWNIRVEGDEKRSDEATQMTVNYIAEAVKVLRVKYKVDDVYMIGFSQGCSFTYLTGIQNPKIFKGLICFGGWLDTDRLSERIKKKAKHLRVFIGHGTEDTMVEYKAASSAQEVLKKFKYDVVFKDFKGGHTIPRDLLKEAIDWMMG